jgi:hypothetical protein
MAKEKKLTLQEQAEQKMQTLVDQHNELVNSVKETNARLAEVKQLLVEHQGYMKGLEACEEDCKNA